MFKRLRNYFYWYFVRKEAIRAVLARERRSAEAAKKRAEELQQERELLHEMLKVRVDVGLNAGNERSALPDTNAGGRPLNCKKEPADCRNNQPGLRHEAR